MAKLFLFGLIGALVILFLQGAILFWLGQPAICECGFVKLWGGIKSSDNSQHITDWYSWSHVIHGFVFYAILWFLFPRMPVWKRFLLAVGVEAVWEVFENTPWMINTYREQALARGYFGDSIINSVTDTIFTAFGFWFARLSPVWVTVAAVVVFELGVGYLIRDNLTLNLVNFFFDSEFIENWQLNQPGQPPVTPDGG